MDLVHLKEIISLGKIWSLTIFRNSQTDLKKNETLESRLFRTNVLQVLSSQNQAVESALRIHREEGHGQR